MWGGMGRGVVRWGAVELVWDMVWRGMIVWGALAGRLRLKVRSAPRLRQRLCLVGGNGSRCGIIEQVGLATDDECRHRLANLSSGDEVVFEGGGCWKW